ncbi:MAG TPA: thiamine pyrophosphate-dependent enzyme [Tenuifilaceae bacterium]|nr:thiamine pyrophosphate-dependent enzyme [Tenuifilaceae bacterium]HPE17211.1 thiamine pyrophosphate-dependent enzyme [Tenuifilaceae bacterium]HPJ44741.1 thiamine pyrophosphate-dependent enzyme [Tenuifilaceae bacterium]HPQ33323.1 thiamine pyrophosphate-dependent enzyme [Tenuifilaceae bacterium]HRX68650.1 thiamine pyrophosphate-dependent enzyme [Tenuifilaceae bacterium]
MDKLLLLGDEAIAQGAIDGGLSGCYAYPGTPSTEIMEYIQHSKQAAQLEIHRKWSTNEKTAMEAAIGMSYAGKRALVCFKHVGLNVAADAFVNAAVTGVNGGLVVLSADDPSMHSSQNEQDSRFYAKFAMIPVLEPSNQQEAYDMAYSAFDLSERLNVPVMIRITTRLAHSRSGVARKEGKNQNSMRLPSDPRQFVLLPAIARVNYKKLLGTQSVMDSVSDASEFNKLFKGKSSKLGVIATGIAYNYLMENLPDGELPFNILKISQYPIPPKMVREIYDLSDELLILEDGYPIVEDMIKGFLNLGKPVHGRLDGAVPRDGELNPTIVAKSLGMEFYEGMEVPSVVRKRPPSLCVGCGHRDVYTDLNEALKEYGTGRVFSDIGCYTLGALPPFNAINSCVDMGASITMAKGAADAGLVPAVAVIGDSTFTHSGMTGLLDAVNENSPITVIISDNSTTGMTGGQDSSALGRIVDICKGIGVHSDHIKVLTPLKKFHEENVKVMKEELAYQGVSVIIPQRECIQTFARRKKAEKKASNQ